MNNYIPEIKGDLEEVRAYRDLQSEPFDFGTGLLTNDSKYSEDAYYEMIQQDLEEYLRNMGNKEKECKRNKLRLDRYKRKKIRDKKLKELYNISGYNVCEQEDEETGNKYLKIVYYSRKKRNAKRITNKIIRNSKYDLNLRNGDYRKIYNYWWEVL